MHLLQIVNICNIYNLIALLFSSSVALAEADSSQQYIDLYKHIAISEMQRTGIPASIKMAQGLLESGAGRSTLATSANNHFGIKCGGSWTGQTFYRKDDDRNAKGDLIKSCFRKFQSADESYFAHSDFLTNQKRYASLFLLDNRDYKAWAKGLRKAGYATDKAYANKLINLIEKYQLYLLDQDTAASLLANTSKGADAIPQAVSITEVQTASSSVFLTENTDTKTTTQSNRRKSNRTKGSRKKTKSRKNKEEATYHRVDEGETLAQIARTYELDEAILRIRNRLPKDAQVLAGEKIYLRKKISLLSRPEFVRGINATANVSDDEFIF